jgi:hypothetical protein
MGLELRCRLINGGTPLAGEMLAFGSDETGPRSIVSTPDDVKRMGQVAFSHEILTVVAADVLSPTLKLILLSD